MDKKAIKNEIDSLIQKLKEHSSSVLDIDKISDAEMALLLDTVDELYQKLAVLKYLKSNPVIEAVVVEKKDEVKQESVKPIETNIAPIDLFGGELPPAVQEKPKAEKKPLKKEEKPVQVASKIHKPKLDNLNSAIGLNDKFQFANELFEGSMQEYNVAIQQLNSAETIESAMDYVENLKQLYNWDFENETVKRLLDLVDRRYS